MGVKNPRFMGHSDDGAFDKVKLGKHSPETSPQAKRHKPSLLITSLTVLTSEASITLDNFLILSLQTM